MHAPVTRREFVGTAAGTVMGAAALASMTRAAAAQEVPATLKVGLIGCGGRGTGAALDALTADPHTELWSLGDLFTDRIESCHAALAGELGQRDADAGGTSWGSRLRADPTRRFAGFDAYAKVIASGVDVVLLATTPAFRPQHLRAAIDAGKHVFCEKPVAVDAPGVRSVIESGRLAENKRLSVMSGFCWRYNLAERAMFDQLARGAIGDIRAISTTYNAGGFPAPQARKPGWSDTEHMLRNWHYHRTLSGDHIVEQAVHAIDWIDWALGVPPERCTAVGGRSVRTDPEFGNIFDHFAVTYEYPNDIRAFHMARHWPNCSSDNSASFMGSKGTCAMHPWTPSHIITGDSPWRYEGPRSNMYVNEHIELFRAIRSSSPVNDSDRMARSTMLAIMGRMAAYTGQTVTWDQAMASTESLVPEAWSWGDAAFPEVAIPGRTALI